MTQLQASYATPVGKTGNFDIQMDRLNMDVCSNIVQLFIALDLDPRSCSTAEEMVAVPTVAILGMARDLGFTGCLDEFRALVESSMEPSSPEVFASSLNLFDKLDEEVWQSRCTLDSDSPRAHDLLHLSRLIRQFRSTISSMQAAAEYHATRAS